MSDATPARPRIGNLADLLAAVPYLLGFHPANSLVVIGVRRRTLSFAARIDLPDRDSAQATAHLAEVCARQPIELAVLIGYGPADRVEPGLVALHDHLNRFGVPVTEVLRVTDNRYWSYTCADPACCDPQGTPFDPATSPVAAAATYAGAVALPDREALVATVAPLDGPARNAMDQATERALQRFKEELGSSANQPVHDEAVFAAGVAAIRHALRRHRRRRLLTDDEVAWLGVLLRTHAVRDAGWRLIQRDPQRYLGLWIDVVRRVSPEFAAAPACLLALSAWRIGDGALASVAVARALAADSAYSLALLLDEALRTGLPPSAVDSIGLAGG